MGETSGLLAGGSKGGGGGDTSGGSRSGLNSAEWKGFGRWRDRRYFGPCLWFREDACEKKRVTTWWGVLPLGQRKRLWDQYKATAKKPFRPIVDTLEVTAGAQICMKNSPMYQHGAIGFTISNGVPKFGQLLNAAWDYTNICRYSQCRPCPTARDRLRWSIQLKFNRNRRPPVVIGSQSKSMQL
ncbi:hypothetical protein pipiens_004901 [Culex pipiens pipiens]|uniref:Uncharacterized protein n=1 Tax=Culex pipiens pipiens TaxID=38569 RepID=A0ABD1CDN9_CULPP